MFYLLYVAFVIAVGYRLLKFLYQMLTCEEIDAKIWGKWAVVTGATDGIGKAFAEHFAQQGLNVVLVSRTQDKLDVVAKEIETKFPSVQTKVIQADFTSLDAEMYSRIEKELSDMEIGVLVNNVGVSYPHPEYFIDLKNFHPNLYCDIINCNISSTVNMTRFVLPGMVSRGGGWIINMSSGFADIPGPLLTIYAASKAFISKFSQDLGIEYKSKGIKVQWLKPGLVATNMSAIKKTSWMVPSPKTYVKSAISDLSMGNCSAGCISHSLMITLGYYASCLFPDIAGNQMLKGTLQTRKKAIKKCKTCNSSGDKKD